MPPYTTPTPCTQRGTSLIEFTIVAVPLLLLGLGALEAALWFFTKQAISLALLQAGRAAIVDHANPRTIEAAFEQAMLPLYSATKPSSAQLRLQAALAQRTRLTGSAPWQIQRLSPTSAAFLDFGDPKLQVAGATGLAVINNNYLAEQHGRHQHGDHHHSRGSLSGLTIFQANTLVLRLHWLHQPVVPGISALLRLLGNPEGSYSQRAMALGGYLPLSQDISLVMQSHPVNWPALANGKVIGQEALPSPASDVANDLAGPLCTGSIWCMRAPMAWGLPSRPDAGGVGSSTPPTSPTPPDGTQPAPDSVIGDLTPDMDAPKPGPDDMACGISLCCVY